MSDNLVCHHWMDRPITELSKEELIEVINFLAKENGFIRSDRDRWFRAGDPVKYLMDRSEKKT